MKNKFPLVSVVMLNYNGLKYLKRTIPPILKLDYPNFEFIIVDNGSTDRSLDFIKKFEKIKIIKSPKLREKNFACNYAIKKSKGEYILMLDNDIIIKDTFLVRKLTSQYCANKNSGSIGLTFNNEGESSSGYIGGFLGYYFIKENKLIELKKLIKSKDYLIGFPHGAAFFIKKSIWNEAGGYDSHLKFGGDDSDLGMRILMNKYENRIFLQTSQLHIGLPERKDNKKYIYKWKLMVYAHLYTITKNYSFFNMVFALFGFSIFAFLKSIKQSVFRIHLGPFLAFFYGNYLFLKNLPYNLEQRKKIQLKRIVKEDIFLKIKPPKFD